MKTKIVILLALVLYTTALHAQAPQQMPDFKLLQSNGKFYTAAQLPKGKPVLLIYFAPDCDHCQVLLKDFFARYPSFSKAHTVLATFKPVSEMQMFERNAHTAQYPSLTVGTEGNTFYLRYFYKLQNTPFVAVFNKDHQLVKSFGKDVSVNDLLQAMKIIQ